VEDSLAAYDYDLPAELIAQRPPERRGGSRLLVVDRRSGSRSHLRFHDLPSLVRPGDVIVLNDTRVFPARLRASRETGARVEVLLVENAPGSDAWTALGKPGRAFREGEHLRLAGRDGVALRTLSRNGKTVHLEILRGGRPLGRDEVLALCDEIGETPLPPYIRREGAAANGPEDRERYQTVFARRTGAVAAPTAGLHFTPAVLAEVEAAGARIVSVTLHVGPGTFEPLDEEAFREGRLHPEWLEVDERCGSEVLRARAEGRRVLAVGTTSARALETLAASGRASYRGTTSLCIRPGHEFRAVDALLTNFHLPRSSLIVLVAAFAGRELALESYREAIRERYRFYSYGDAMLIL
jgi:S-adenosylmethionine:tRNA ribosyltransferase-isomerase